MIFPITDPNSILLKIKSIYANRIYSGEKKYELRKVTPQKKPKIIFLYEHDNIKAVTGAFIIRNMFTLPLESLWQKVGESAARRENFFNYYKGFEKGIAFEIEEVFKFPEPLTSSSIFQLDDKYIHPQSFIYLNKFRVIEKKLFELLNTELERKLSLVELLNPRNNDFKKFEEIALKEVSRNYDEIDKSFIENIITCSKLGYDPNGFFTIKKNLYTIYLDKKRVGFTVITEKLGKSIKTGPTILLKRYRLKGYGKLIRKKIELEYSKKGKRKIYCTCNAHDTKVLHYLLNSGMKIEAHLINQYKSDSSELVFGKLLIPSKKKVESIKRKNLKLSKLKDSIGEDYKAFKKFMLNYFKEFYLEVDIKFIDDIFNASKRFNINHYNMKDKKVFLLTESNKKIIGIIICSPKRGGSVKLTLVIKTNNFRAIKSSMSKVESFFQNKSRTKLNLNTPIYDYQMIGYLNKLGYKIEGLLEEPYRSGVDLVQMGKIL